MIDTKTGLKSIYLNNEKLMIKHFILLILIAFQQTPNQMEDFDDAIDACKDCEWDTPAVFWIGLAIFAILAIFYQQRTDTLKMEKVSRELAEREKEREKQ